MMEFQDSMNDLKSASLELLYSQVSSLITSYNELKTSGELSDVFEKRLLLLQKTISNMKSLIQSMEDFNDLNGDIGEKTVSSSKADDLADFISNSKDNSEDNSEKPVNDTGLVFNSPLISDVPTNPNLAIGDSVPAQSTTGSVIVDDTNNKDENTGDDTVLNNGSLIFDSPAKDENVGVTPVTVEENQAPVDNTVVTQDPVGVENSVVPVEDTSNDDSNDVTPVPISDTAPISSNDADTTPVNSDDVVPVPISSSDVDTTPVNSDDVIPVPISSNDVDTAPISSNDADAVPISSNDVDTAPISSNDVNVRAIASLEKFKRVSDSPVKAIIVNDSQFDKLAGSLSQQAEQLDFGASSSDDNMSIEDMIEKANDLYNRGDKQAAEEIYNKINSMTLVKKTA